jgi:transglutaminase-like putative cysteine protease
MLIAVHHRTAYRYSRAFNHSVQSLRLFPPSGISQRVVEWHVDIPGLDHASRYTDAFGNQVALVTPPGASDHLDIIAHGLIETIDTAGVAGFTGEAVPPGVFLRPERMTETSPSIETMAKSCQAPARLTTLHNLLAAIHKTVAYDTEATHALTTAIEAFKAKRGVCQDHAHIFIGAARILGIPARYVTGYLLVEGETSSVAHHAWAEAYVDELGWIGFDAANGVSPTEYYVRLAVGLDAITAAPVRGNMRGGGDEKLTVEVVVDASQQ